MDSFEISLKLKGDRCLKRVVWGVFPRNRLPAPLLPGGYVVNTDNIDGPGIHWIALWVKEESIEFMDSFGHKPSHYGWSFSLPTLYNIKPLQSRNSAACGAYCLYYLYYRCRGIAMDDILLRFSDDDRRSNDACVVNFVSAL
jgi:hypothetical protein